LYCRRTSFLRLINSPTFAAIQQRWVTNSIMKLHQRSHGLLRSQYTRFHSTHSILLRIIKYGNLGIRKWAPIKAEDLSTFRQTTQFAASDLLSKAKCYRLNYENRKTRMFKYISVFYWKCKSINNLNFIFFNYFPFKYHLKSPCTTFLTGRGTGPRRPEGVLQIVLPPSNTWTPTQKNYHHLSYWRRRKYLLYPRLEPWPSDQLVYWLARSIRNSETQMYEYIMSYSVKTI
jgi:hypothetical protein